MKNDEKYMWRALQLARNGEGRVSPNPMVGSVIVSGHRIIGEGFHAYYGGPHAEVNAIGSVSPSDRKLLKDSTIYVTLEPCAHHGKTPPCANLIVETGIPRVVIGSLDPNPLVAGKGVRILEDAGVSVECGLLERECQLLNRRFMKAQVSSIPFITLKWAQSSDGFMASLDMEGKPCPVKFSSPLSSVWVHRLRGSADAIMVGGNTQLIDSPRLDNRLWGGNSPKKFVAHHSLPVKDMLQQMRSEGITSVVVEGGAALLESLIKEGLYDEIRVETSSHILSTGLRAPSIPDDVILVDSFHCRGNLIRLFRR